MLKKPFFLISLLSICIVGCSQHEEYKETRSVLYTYVTIHCFYPKGIDIEKVIDSCWAKLDRIDYHMNPYSNVGDLILVNQSQGGRVKVNEDLVEVVKMAKDWHKDTEKIFDISIYPLVKMWEEADQKNRYPSGEMIEKTKELVGMDRIIIEEDLYIKKTSPNMMLDTGALVKGWAMDQVGEILERAGIDNFLINAGGDLYAGGKHKKRSWKIGIQDPAAEKGALHILRLTDRAVATSGDYEKFFTISGKKYSHIINPVTGQPAEGASSATVICEKAVYADMLATTLSIMGGEKGIAYIENLNDDVEAMIVENRSGEKIIFKSSGYKKYL